MDDFSFRQFQTICTAHGFVQNGKAFFRVVGDGVMQVIRCKCQLRLHGDLISVGLFSMYGSLLPQWFTASGSIQRYSIMNCFYQNNRPVVFTEPLSIQLKMLSEHVLPWLDTVNTQKKLSPAIAKLDPRWNDFLKIGPYLVCGEYNHAKKVVREILPGNDFTA